MSIRGEQGHDKKPFHYGDAACHLCALWQQGQAEQVFRAGDLIKVPLKQVHTAITYDQASTVLVFRVHKKGMPERVLVE